ncbi:MAG: VWA domain-containing protein [Alphaproteobacteria bacterium]|nr:VWA domain-containing protein [Alphaproteobacteria bacterium]
MSKLPSDHQSTRDLDAFLQKVRNTPAPSPTSGERGRLIFALDATMSRQPTWDAACQIQGEMFEATKAIGGLNVQLVYFRGFGECKAGAWQPDAAGLARLMSKVACHAGKTQIGKVLSHIKKQTENGKVGAVVYVGDAFEEDIDVVCHQAGELGLLGVPVFLFQEGSDPIAERAFREIARLTNGAWCPFNLASADRLKALLSAVAVYAAGGVKALEDYGRTDHGEVAAALLKQLQGPKGKPPR